MPPKDQGPLIIGPQDANQKMAQSALAFVNDLCGCFPGLDGEIKAGFSIVVVTKSGRQIVVNGHNAGPDPSHLFKRVHPAGGFPPIPPLVR